MSKEHDALKKKELEFNEVLSKRLKQQNEVDVITAERDRLKEVKSELTAANTILDAEITVIKKEILQEKRNMAALQRFTDAKDVKIE